MAITSAILKQLKKERDAVKRQLAGLNAAIAAFSNESTKTKATNKRRKLSAKGRARIAAAQRARWAKFRAKKKAA